MPTFNMRSLWLLATLVSTTGLTACGPKILEYRNVQIVNGKVYAGDANEAFSGQITNVPSGVILGSQQGFRKAVTTIEKTLPALTLDYVRATGIDNFPTDARIPVPVYCDAHVNSGYLDGKVTCKAANTDTDLITMTFSSGQLNGELGSYAPDDTSHLLAKLTFTSGQPDGRMEIYSPVTHRLVHAMTWDNGVLNGEEEGFDENTGNRILHASLVDGKYQGDVTGYAPDGKELIYRVSYANGLKQGVEEAFDPQTGKPTGHADYADGKLQGAVRRWDASGKLIYEKDYQDGQEVPDGEAVRTCLDRRYTAFNAKSGNGGNVDAAMRDGWEAECKEDLHSDTSSAAPTGESARAPSGDMDACVSGWTIAYRRKNGDDSIVTADQLGEWRSWCREGKRPE
ncbi:toxin-antitoxin system YwqK family antitoxin [Paraburkholderia bryophila]|uniref:toxin-antitoxin system YwqK family antitoxin n=1 Tax=Paraburkholderia bryophila TaxID=420952 RepID=UPI00234926BE|nr:toxin-antitoxin system YwqK family antitoxin [Paraburkholderia bryophila]WCM18717.1 toxin-antitoxin system YwqK family antitoxin [Paraburkholderia bryophila]